MSFECGDCDRKFYSEHAVEQHCRDIGHDRYYCYTCDRSFSSQNALQNHLSNAATHRMAKQYECLCCDKSFHSQDALDNHCEAKGHNSQWYCNMCKRHFSTARGLEQHCTSAATHRTCTVCDIVFQTVQSYEKHQSKKHREGSKRVPCHFCNRVFKSPSAYAQHIESGVHNVNRHHVTQAVHSLRVVPTITLPMQFGLTSPPVGQITAWDESEYSASTSEGGAFTTPIEVSPTAPGPPLRQEEQTGAAVPGPMGSVVAREENGQLTFGPPRFQHFALGEFTTAQYVPGDFIHLGIPYSCHLCFRTFRTIFALTMHMNSAVHDPDAFICPNQKCKKQFTLISGLIQHLESGTCGLASKQEVYQRFERLTARFSRLLTA